MGDSEKLMYEGLRSDISEIRVRLDQAEEVIGDSAKIIQRLNAENAVLKESNNRMIAFFNNLPNNREFMAVFVRNAFEAYAEAERNIKERGQGDIKLEWSSEPFDDPSCLKVVLETVEGSPDAIHIYIKDEKQEWVDNTTNLNLDFVKEITDHLYKEDMDKDTPHYLIMKYAYAEALKTATEEPTQTVETVVAEAIV